MEFSESDQTKLFVRVYKIMRWIGMASFLEPTLTVEKKLKYNCWKYYSIILLVPYLLLVIKAVYDIFVNFADAETIVFVLFLLQMLSDIGFIVLTMSGTIFQENIWRQLFRKLKNLEKKIIVADDQKLFCQYFCSIGLTTFFSLETVIFTIVLIEDDISWLLTYKTIYDFTLFCKISLTILYYNFVMITKAKYEEIENSLQRGCYKGKFSKIKITYTKKRLTEIKQLILETSVVVNLINKILSRPIFAIFLSTFVATVAALDMLYSNVTDKKYGRTAARIVQSCLLGVSFRRK